MRHKPYHEVRAARLPIKIEDYKQIHQEQMKDTETAMDIWKKTKVLTEVSDVIVVNKESELSCYYVDEEHFRRISGFIQLNPTGAVINMDTKDYEISGKKGNGERQIH